MEVAVAPLFFKFHEPVEKFEGPGIVPVSAAGHPEYGDGFVYSAEDCVPFLENLHGHFGVEPVLFQGYFFTPEVNVAEISPAQFLDGQIKDMGFQPLFHRGHPCK